MPRERTLYFPETSEEGLIEYLGDFKEQVLPIFLKAGYSQDTALTVWWLNKVNNSLDEILTMGIPVAPDNDEDEDDGSPELKT